jgi:molybdopterin converting factor small subunit
LLARFAMPEPERLSLLEDALSGADRNLFDESRKADPQDYLFGFWRDKGDILFMELFFNSLPWFYRLFFGEEGFSAFREKTGQMQALLRDQKTLQAVLSDLVDDLNRRTVANQVLLFRDHSFEDLAQHISENY